MPRRLPAASRWPATWSTSRPTCSVPSSSPHSAKELEALGVEVEVLTEKEMKKLGMGALLGVAQGSVRPPRLVVMQLERRQGRRTSPIAFVGKGVVFDTGGISIKPAAGMEDMKCDMGGAAAVIGLMHALAARKAKVNARRRRRLVENMVDGNAQRPGRHRHLDVGPDHRGAEHRRRRPARAGRRALVRQGPLQAEVHGRSRDADRRHHGRARAASMPACSPTTTSLPSGLTAAGKATGEKLWRMPLGAAYDKMIDSKIADMKNIGGRYGGAITAAQFLQRFVKDTPWAHLDIAGTALGSPASEINQSWGSGFGVRLLDRLVRDHYEG